MARIIFPSRPSPSPAVRCDHDVDIAQAAAGIMAANPIYPSTRSRGRADGNAGVATVDDERTGGNRALPIAAHPDARTGIPPAVDRSQRAGRIDECSRRWQFREKGGGVLDSIGNTV